MSDVVLITGAAGGLGVALARAFHAAGYRVGVADIDAAAADEVARALDPSGETSVGLDLDVRHGAAWEAACGALETRWGSIEALVNNASITEAKPVLAITADEFDAVMAVNLRGTFLGCQTLGRRFKARSYGRIVNLASLAGQNGGTATGAHYAASKGAILTLTRVFARDLAPFGVTANSIAPGPLDSPMVHDLIPIDRMAQFTANIPVGTLGQPDFVGAMAVRLCGRDAGFMTGATLDINGGLYMR